jgi:hypothetical protein
MGGQNNLDPASYHHLPIGETRPAKILWEITEILGLGFAPAGPTFWGPCHFF